ncbi:crossover junction endonuclease EME1B-like [Phoenix dactylifera]|uniref:Crossover junction endonuclease EME1B-like n=1 Tax=Phoenix dactylifera TaxID=42345 RepID=A0A8B9ANL6_PHODC|nr:crossover junction endonuclease EME1B-like [Phoenix dactylifera]
MGHHCPPPFAVKIPSDDDHNDRDDDATIFSPSPPPLKKRLELDHGSGAGGRGVGGGVPPLLLVIDDDPTPRKPNRDPTPSFVAETLSSRSRLRLRCLHRSVYPCSLQSSKRFVGEILRLRSSLCLTGITGLICLESDNESEGSGRALRDNSDFPVVESPVGTGSGKDHSRLYLTIDEAVSGRNDTNDEVIPRITNHGSFDGSRGATNFIQILGDSPPHGHTLAEDSTLQAASYEEEHNLLGQLDSTAKRKGNHAAVGAAKDNKNEPAARKKQLKEEKARLIEERKRKRQQDKLQKEALKAEEAETKKWVKEKQKWERGKYALKSVVADFDAKVVENGLVGGHLLTRFAEKGLSFRITSNPIERSIMWKMNVPDKIAQISSAQSEVPYILFVYQAEEFCDLVISESLIDHIHRVRSHYPSFTICYLTNKLMSYINKREQSQYKNPSNVSCWKRPPIEEILSKLTTHYTRVHSRQCIDEADLAEHVVGLTSSLASCQFRKKLTWLTVNANGSIIPKDFIDRNLVKKNIWLKALISIPKVQPRYAIAIWKKYPTMRSLLNVYMDPNKSVHEKEFLLKDLMIEGLLGKEDRRLGEICSKRVYRILMAQSGGIKTEDVEEGADFFGC